MLRHLTTAQVTATLRSAVLPLLCILVLPMALLAQQRGADSAALDPRDSLAASTPASTPASPVGESEDNGDDEGASPAPEPDTAMLLGTGSVVLLVLYTRRRARMVAPSAAQQ